ncbi:hypothetical protein CTEN210_17653 [Chaetoceros tenuissimus]|uniref:Integrase zinc-binding domain-containing protein n=1 Tax=Chaetoceros tenuissimus TaxID=426638 RepID=A0AAD3DBY4_9STRA|nr:hypothetical protein CTEN210_17653 [Chaetoceros tenuissimus]
MIIEEFAPEIKYIKGEANTVADSLSRLPLIEDNGLEDDQVENKLYELFMNEDVQEDQERGFPLEYKQIRKKQEQALRDDEVLKQEMQTDAKKQSEKKLFGVKMFDDERLITYRNRIYIPKSLQNETIHWYHWALQHPGENKLMRTIQIHSAWPNMVKQIQEYTRVCKQCQLFKKRSLKYRKLPPKQLPLLRPWEEVALI